MPSERERRLEAALASPVLPALNGLRAVAILLLLIAHYARDLGGDVADALIPLGNYSILLFFVVTGFAATNVMIREFTATGDLAPGLWLTRKALRIYPTLIVILLAESALQYARTDTWPPTTRYVGFLMLVGNYYYALADGDALRHGLGHLWSIKVGAHFLVPWVFILRAACRRGRVNDLVGPVAAVVVLSSTARAVFSTMDSIPAAYTYLSTETRIGQIAFGALLALLVAGPHRERVTRVLAQPLAGVALLSIALVVFSAHWIRPPIQLAATGYLTLYLLAQNATGVSRVLEARPLALISLISYSVFTWHLYGLYFNGLFDGVPPLLRAPLVILPTLAVGGVMFVLLEWPARRLAERFRPPGLTRADASLETTAPRV